jgi:CheY-like chemotaxis protein
MAGSSDGGAHLSSFVGADYTTRLLTEWVPDPLTLEEAVRRLTAIPAAVHGIHDRGTVRAGAWADLVLVDLFMNTISGMEVLKATVEAHKDVIVVIMTGNPTVQSSIEALRAGAWDYLPKPFSASHLQVLVGRAAHASAATRENREIIKPSALMTQSGSGEEMALLGVSPSFRKAVELAQKVAATDASVMISGESGTGKEMIAQFIHKHSRRTQRKLVPVNCAAMPDNLLESEMFGYRKGACTGADRDKAGLLEVANGQASGVFAPVGMRNRIIIGDFRIWQRGTSFSPSPVTYGADRFASFKSGASAGDYARSTDVPSGQGFTYSASFNNADVRHAVELLVAGNAGEFVSGSTWTVSFWAKVSSGTSSSEVGIQPCVESA